jgi:hypothetical protein
MKINLDVSNETFELLKEAVRLRNEFSKEHGLAGDWTLEEHCVVALRIDAKNMIENKKK